QKACPTQAIVFGTKDEMKQWADKRIADLKSRGFDKAALYAPPGVSGPHVMYVLHHADKPHVYAGLPDNPRISPLVDAWKGVGKYAGMAVIALTAAAGMIHHILQGPNRVTEEEEESADKLAGGKTSQAKPRAARTFVCAVIRAAPASITGSWRRPSCCCW